MISLKIWHLHEDCRDFVDTDSGLVNTKARNPKSNQNTAKPMVATAGIGLADGMAGSIPANWRAAVPFGTGHGACTIISWCCTCWQINILVKFFYTQIFVWFQFLIRPSHSIIPFRLQYSWKTLQHLCFRFGCILIHTLFCELTN